MIEIRLMRLLSRAGSARDYYIELPYLAGAQTVHTSSSNVLESASKNRFFRTYRFWIQVAFFVEMVAAVRWPN